MEEKHRTNKENKMADGKDREPRRARHGPGGRLLLNYRGAEGWQQRIYYPTLAAGAIGGGVGLLTGLFRDHGIAKLSATYAANLAIITSCFCGAREIVRELRAADPDDLINSVLGGIASGAFLGRIQGGRPQAVRYAILFAAIGTGLEFGALQLREYRLQHYLESTSTDTLVHGDSSPTKNPKAWWTWPEWAPIQKVDGQAAAKRAEERDLHIQRTVDKLKKGESL